MIMLLFLGFQLANYLNMPMIVHRGNIVNLCCRHCGVAGACWESHANSILLVILVMTKVYSKRLANFLVRLILLQFQLEPIVQGEFCHKHLRTHSKFELTLK